jgi:DAK2 domain fusion protein YloV
VLRALNAVAARRWVDLSVTALSENREAIDRINVYPVADGDTGTNLLRTMRSAADAVESIAPTTPGGVLAALAKGALAGAQGNSGMLLSQILRGIAEELRDVPDIDGGALCGALTRANELAFRAVSDPAEGTILSVLRAAADAARSAGSGHLDVVVHKATLAAILALRETTAQLPALADAGVVDAGGRGLVILLDVLHAVVCDGARLAPEPPDAGAADLHSPSYADYAYEVMYLLGDTDADRTTRLRHTLSEMGDCVSVVGDGADAWAVHVHCDDIGAAIEAGIELGRVHQIRVVRFADQAQQPGQRYEVEVAVLACVPGDAVAELFRAEGARVISMDRSASVVDITAAITATSAAYLAVLPNDAAIAETVEEAAAAAVRAGREVVVVPTASPVQGLAALAVHDPSRRRADDTVAMTEAAAATRRGELVVAEKEALTWVGRCQPGDVLGLIDGEVVLIGSDVGVAARDLVDRMLVPGGELVTALVGDDAPRSLADELATHLRRTHPEVELACYQGGDLGALLLLGAE